MEVYKEDEEHISALDKVTIQFLEELKQYQAIGTVEECQTAVERIPPHHSYVEPYFGSGAMLFNKPTSRIETVNDLDRDVVNLFWCIRQDAEKLSKLVMATPFSRQEYEDSFKLDVFEITIPDDDEPYHKALRFLVKCWQGHGFRTNGHKVGWKNDVQGRERSYALWNWYRLPDWIIEVAERLRKVQIEHRPALEIIERFNYGNVFMYIDTPYLLGTRTAKQYKHETTDADHEELLKILLKIKAKIMISGYESDIYNDYLKDWHKACFKSCAEHHGIRQEVIWMNYEHNQQLSFAADFPEVQP
ncbi:MAG: DNA adenine methylase [Lachnospiraceae bacterium]|nr:DNA adenine methylase [Lachnospiraceae bacterium]